MAGLTLEHSVKDLMRATSREALADLDIVRLDQALVKAEASAVSSKTLEAARDARRKSIERSASFRAAASSPGLGSARPPRTNQQLLSELQQSWSCAGQACAVM